MSPIPSDSPRDTLDTREASPTRGAEAATHVAPAVPPSDDVARLTEAVRDHAEAPIEAPAGPEHAVPWIQRGPEESMQAYDRRWLHEVYAGDVPQLTFRAVATGMALGAILAVSNVYVGLKAGWAMGVAITACVLSTAMWRGFARAGLGGRPMSVLEQNCMQSTASAAGYATGSVLVTAVPAYMLMTGLRIEVKWLLLWTFFLSILGLALAVPVMRRFLHYERLAWPSSVAAAQTLRSLHDHGRVAVMQARRLFLSAGIAALIRWSIDNRFSWWTLPRWPETVDLPGRLAGQPAAAYTLGFDASALYLGAGALLGMRVAVWMLVGSALTFAGVAPWMHAAGHLPEVGYGRIMLGFALWVGAALMVTASLVSLALQWRQLARGLGGLGRTGTGAPRETGGTEELARVEVPTRWAWAGGIPAAVAIVAMGEWVFGIPWPLGLLGVAATLVGVVVAVRATGETDITPVGSLARVGQLGFGALAPGSVATNLLGTSIVTTGSAAASDLMINMKCGHFLGAHPRRQYVAQFLGVVVGTLAVVPAFLLLVPDASVLGQENLPAPAAASWRLMAELAAGGLSQLGPLARWGLGIGIGLAVLLTVAAHLRPGWRRFLPSAVALGMGAVIPFQISLSFFAGAALAAFFQRRSERAGEDLVVPVSSGLIAGDSLMGVLLALLLALGLMGS